MQLSTILFLCTHNSCRSQMAEGFARKYAPEGVTVASAGTVATRVDPRAVQVMRGLGIDITRHRSKTIIELGRARFDLVITLCDRAKDSCPIFPGAPATIHWPVTDPSTAEGSDSEIMTVYLQIASEIEKLVFDLFNRGYLEALFRQRENFNNILNCLTEGVIAHDLNRKVFFFSKGLEEITGFRESEVLGRDCNEVFKPRLCDQNCGFCSGAPLTALEKKQYATTYITKNGVHKEFDVSVVPLRDGTDKQIGVVASFTDRTSLRELERKLESEQEFRGIIGQDHKMQHTYEVIRELAQCDFPVVIMGESGTGKELVARAIHNESARRDNLFVPVNCGALPEGTLESELFGHVKGAFTGAIRDKKGRFELADGGTLFLDEVAELSQAMQVKLLRVLQEGIFEPVGGEKSLQVDVRVISATNKNLKDMVSKGDFRDDLFYRLSVIPLELPPLRERKNDIPLLAQSFLSTITGKLGRQSMQFSDETMAILMEYSWPGNVRQLQNAIQFSLIKCRNKEILPEHLPPEVLATAGAMRRLHAVEAGPAKAGRKPKLDEEQVRISLKKAGGNKAKAARILGVGRATLYNFLKENGHLNEIGRI